MSGGLVLVMEYWELRSRIQQKLVGCDGLETDY